jgi:cytochrome c1
MRGALLAAAIGAFALFGGSIAGDKALAAGDAIDIPGQDWQHEGIFGTFDRGELQRGFQVFKEVCASCHALEFIAFRNLVEIGFTEDEAKAIAKEYEVEDGPNDEGDMFMRSARLSDYWPAPFANDNAARASNGGALPPDLSLMTKARAGGADYLYALLIGYEEEAPAGVELADGMNYNHYFTGHQIAMPPPLYDEAVDYIDGTPATLAQHARDVTSFLAWAAEPELEDRKQTGLKVLIFVGILTALLFIIYKRTWARLH